MSDAALKKLLTELDKFVTPHISAGTETQIVFYLPAFQDLVWDDNTADAITKRLGLKVKFSKHNLDFTLRRTGDVVNVNLTKKF